MVGFRQVRRAVACFGAGCLRLRIAGYPHGRDSTRVWAPESESSGAPSIDAVGTLGKNAARVHVIAVHTRHTTHAQPLTEQAREGYGCSSQRQRDNEQKTDTQKQSMRERRRNATQRQRTASRNRAARIDRGPKVTVENHGRRSKACARGFLWTARLRHPPGAA